MMDVALGQIIQDVAHQVLEAASILLPPAGPDVCWLLRIRDFSTAVSLPLQNRIDPRVHRGLSRSAGWGGQSETGPLGPSSE